MNYDISQHFRFLSDTKTSLLCTTTADLVQYIHEARKVCLRIIWQKSGKRYLFKLQLLDKFPWHIHKKANKLNSQYSCKVILHSNVNTCSWVQQKLGSWHKTFSPLQVHNFLMNTKNQFLQEVSLTWKKYLHGISRFILSTVFISGHDSSLCYITLWVAIKQLLF